MKERANRLYELRKSRNLTQTAVAYRLNLSLSRISAYENGENIPCDVLRVFANFYSVSIDTMYIVIRVTGIQRSFMQTACRLDLLGTATQEGTAD